MPWKQGYTISDEVGMSDADIVWPGDHTCCLRLTVDLSPASGPDGITRGDLTAPTSLFGITEGLDNVLATLAWFRLRATVVVPALMAEIYPERVAAVVAAGHEIACGGLVHADVRALPVAEEQAQIDAATAILTRIVGTKPRGWFSLPRQNDQFAVGSLSPATVGLLIDAGYDYLGNGLADDVPHYWVSDFTARTALLTLPYYYHSDDQFFLMFPTEGSGLDRVEPLRRNWLREFEAQYRRGRCFGMTLHPKGIGWGHHLQMLDEVLERICSFPGLWNATGAECAEYWHARYPAASSLQLTPSIWQDYEGSLS